jgi:hypothetical protein
MFQCYIMLVQARFMSVTFLSKCLVFCLNDPGSPRQNYELYKNP